MQNLMQTAQNLNYSTGYILYYLPPAKESRNIVNQKLGKGEEIT